MGSDSSSSFRVTAREEGRTPSGESDSLDQGDAASFDGTESEAQRWANEQLGLALDDLKHGIDERLAELRQRLDERKRAPVTENTTVTPNAVPALFDLLKKLPTVIGNSLSGEHARVESATSTMADLQQQLSDAGIDVGDGFTSFPDRLASLRSEPEA